MNRRTLALALVAAGVWPAHGPALAAVHDWRIVPGRRVGPVDAQTSETLLRKRLGAANVASVDLPLAEGTSRPATTLYPGDPTREASVLWRDGADRGSPESVLVRTSGSRWRTAEGIGIGTSLAALRRLNAAPLTLMGFGWDYAGTVVDAHGGRLAALGTQRREGLVGRTLIVRLEPAPGRDTSPDYERVSGERAFSADDPAMRALDPRVYELLVELAPH